ncbi:dienelactone hydrolase family protein [Pseudoluteimonas lycopersici]|uniref:Dienelactone hydrolase family protein n=1 Tax=Pseudoluteimonas lycopersici TaxID=1324796 RepID=A0A516V2F5_9GAMM|nr:dienelactone hydrolase family protein [Lysobacter lycopersici]QDQ72703.1 dienelactone hydrolase family protein [Lysobacter lycopersici]
MGRDIIIDTPAGKTDAWRADPEGAPLGALVVVQEIFGVNAHMRSVADRFAAKGYIAVAPALFDPAERNIELGYDDAGMRRGIELRAEVGTDRAIAIVGAAAKLLQDEGHKVGVVGYCWGGTLAFLANTRFGLPAVAYYGGRVVDFLGEPLRAPMLFHFGADDAGIPPESIAKIRLAYPQAPVHVYPGAGHAFNRDIDPSHYHADSAALALRRTLDFFAAALG